MPPKNRQSLEDIYYNNQELIDNVLNFVPIVGTLKDGYDFYKNPNWENGINLALSLGSDILGAKFLGGGIKAYKTARKANKAIDAVKGQANEMRIINKSLKRTGQPAKYSDKRITLQQNIEDNLKYRNPIKDAIRSNITKYIATDVPINAIQFQNKYSNINK